MIKLSNLLVLLSIVTSNIYMANSYTLTASVLNQLGFSSLKSQHIYIKDENIDKFDPNALNGYRFLMEFTMSSGIKTIDVHAFEHLLDLEWLNLSFNSLTSFEYLQIPKNLDTLYLTGNKMNYFALSRTMSVLKCLGLDKNSFRSFKSMNFTLLANLTHLYLSDNPHAYPNEISGHMKPLVNLEYLELKNLSINSIDTNFFKTNTKLLYINLSGNKLSSLDNQTFIGLLYLQNLCLSYNNLTKIATGTFQSSVSLTNNQISQIDSSSFIGNFMKVDLSYNRITKFSRAFINRFDSIDLSYNQITELDNLTFAGANNINDLILSNNKIEKIAPGSLNNITNLYLDNNLLTEVSNMTFVGQNQLRNITLSNNNLSTIESGTFANLPNLMYVYLDNNQLTQLDSSIFAGSNNLYRISVTGNPNLSTTNIQSLCPPAATYCQVFY